jgi:hypothetical protein
VRFPTSPAE